MIIFKSKKRGRKDLVARGLENEGLRPRRNRKSRRWGKKRKKEKENGQEMKLSEHKKIRQATWGLEMGR